jgi:hypothetical protein
MSRLLSWSLGRVAKVKATRIADFFIVLLLLFVPTKNNRQSHKVPSVEAG